MFVTITTQDSPSFLKYAIDNECGNRWVALHEIFYKVVWFNISESKKNNKVQKFDGLGNLLSELIIPDGYYGVCSLKEELSNMDITLKLNNANLKAILTFKPEEEEAYYYFDVELTKMLGFAWIPSGDPILFSINFPEDIKKRGYQNFIVTPDVYTYEGKNPLNLALHSLLYVHLDELSTDENLCDGMPSTVLRAFPSGKAAYCDYEIIQFPNLQFKRLACGQVGSFNIKITDKTGKGVKCDSLHIVLEIK